VVEVHTRWATAHASSVESLTEFSDAVFVGRVTRLAGQREEPPPPGARGSFPISRYEVAVQTAVSGPVEPGSTLVMEQSGGMVGASDTGQRLVILEGDTPLEPGRTYLFFATRKDDGAYISAPFTRLALGPGQRLAALEPWRDIPAMRALDGRTVPEAVAEVQSVAP
jgi:hypothetical protein